MGISLNGDLQKKLVEMAKRDQFARISLDSINDESVDFWAQVEKIDEDNNPKLKEIFKKYGWPGISLVGLEGTSAMWLLVQHQDKDVHFQKECLELLKRAVQANESPFSNYAYLVDRVKKNENLPQIYGTQFVQMDGKFTLYDLEDPENVNKRRYEAGLCSFEEYKEVFKEFFHLQEEAFK